MGRRFKDLRRSPSYGLRFLAPLVGGSYTNIPGSVDFSGGIGGGYLFLRTSLLKMESTFQSPPHGALQLDLQS
ncbi:hypothetical protein Hypma_015038 [Hypsizygus marmoreus]|uniref:Uncharacterized protein n=1 Tax=Hypsizygus marmoreus TaxID=39966 RepID=A0A369KCL1_HYPMA|nr:hypothetical protein Hypma_015038 [Hypsizygus marmoreus]